MTDGVDWEKIKKGDFWTYNKKNFELARDGPEYFKKNTIQNGEVREQECVRYSSGTEIKESPTLFTDDNGKVWQWDKNDPVKVGSKYRRVSP